MQTMSNPKNSVWSKIAVMKTAIRKQCYSGDGVEKLRTAAILNSCPKCWSPAPQSALGRLNLAHAPRTPPAFATRVTAAASLRSAHLRTLRAPKT